MNYKPNSSTIVIAGKWNRYLLNPSWVAKELFKEENVNVQISTALDGPPRIVKDNIIFVVTNDHIVITAVNPEDEDNLKNVEKIANQIVTILEHTPVTALGINFTFMLDNGEGDDFEDYFILEDNDQIVENGLILESGVIQRKFNLDDNLLNLTITKGDQIEIQFNYHFNFNSSGQIKDYLDGTKFVEKRTNSNNLMNTIYNKKNNDD